MNLDMRYLESYGMQLDDDHDDGDLMADASLDERAKWIIKVTLKSWHEH